ncbi:MaoC family dehydratase [Reinekea sp.]|jgi:acyl dehydratase|uniref:MaoC family dehydratase n=1 Tax=Reinekea sp. TaxID=1970455 RepID=UPI003988B352
MSVIDFLKEKSDRLAKNRDEIVELIQPQLRGYFNEIFQSAKNSPWMNWALDQKILTSGSDAQETINDRWLHDNNADALAMLEKLSSDLDSIVYTGQWMAVEQDRINQFAEVTEDQQWIHTDPERAKVESPFRGTIAHGFLTLSLLPKLTNAVDPDQPPYPGAKMVVNMGLNQVRFPYPLKAGSHVRATKKIIAVTPVRRGLEVTEEITVEIENCRRPACVAQTLLLLVY